MEKISGILPASSRVTTVDLARSQPVRSGTPSFGRPVIEASNRNAMPKTVLNEASWKYNQIMQAREDNRSNSERISEVNENYFSQQMPGVEQDTYLVGENLSLIA